MTYDYTPIEEVTANISTAIDNQHQLLSPFRYGRVAIGLNNQYGELIDPAYVRSTNAVGITIGTGDGDERILRFIPWSYIASVYVTDPQIAQDRITARRDAYRARWGSLIQEARLWEELGPDAERDDIHAWLTTHYPSPVTALTAEQLTDDVETIHDILSDY
jgi:hypothetical protein